MDFLFEEDSPDDDPFMDGLREQFIHGHEYFHDGQEEEEMQEGQGPSFDKLFKNVIKCPTNPGLIPRLLSLLDHTKCRERHRIDLFRKLDSVLQAHPQTKQQMREGFRSRFYSKLEDCIVSMPQMDAFSRFFVTVFRDDRSDAVELLNAWSASGYPCNLGSLLLATSYISETQTMYYFENIFLEALGSFQTPGTEIALMEANAQFLETCLNYEITKPVIDRAIDQGLMCISTIFVQLFSQDYPVSITASMLRVFAKINSDFLFFRPVDEFLIQYASEGLDIVINYISQLSGEIINAISRFWLTLSAMPVISHVTWPEFIIKMTADALTHQNFVINYSAVENILKAWINMKSECLTDQMIAVLMDDSDTQKNMLERIFENEKTTIFESMAKAMNYNFDASVQAILSSLAMNNGTACLIEICACLIELHSCTLQIDTYVEADLAMASAVTSVFQSMSLPDHEYGIPNMACPTGFFEKTCCDFCQAVANCYFRRSSVEQFIPMFGALYTRMLCNLQCRVIHPSLFRQFLECLDVSKWPLPLLDGLLSHEGFVSLMFDGSYRFLVKSKYKEQSKMWLENVFLFASKLPFEDGLNVLINNILRIGNDTLSVAASTCALKYPSTALLDMFAVAIFPVLGTFVGRQSFLVEIAEIADQISKCTVYGEMSSQAIGFTKSILVMIDALAFEMGRAEPSEAELMSCSILRACHNLLKSRIVNFGILELYDEKSENVFIPIVNHIMIVVNNDESFLLNNKFLICFVMLIETLLKTFDELHGIEPPTVLGIMDVGMSIIHGMTLHNMIPRVFECFLLLLRDFEPMMRGLAEIAPDFIHKFTCEIINYRYTDYERPLCMAELTRDALVIECLFFDRDLFSALLGELDEECMEGTEDFFGQVFSGEKFDGGETEFVEMIKKPMRALIDRESLVKYTVPDFGAGI